MADNVGTPVSTSRSARDVISLGQPRPGQARRSNEYIETPINRPLVPPEVPKTAKPIRHHIKDGTGTTTNLLAGVHRIGRRTGVRHHHAPVSGQPVAVTSQPTTFKKEKSTGHQATTITPQDDHGDSIICRECGRCKCEACRSPRPLPSKWICNDKFQCSAAALVDYCSCLCCAKGLFYHLTKDYELDNDVSCADQPCSCAPHKRFVRWSCLGLLSIALPCLCCYWPLKGCVRLCEMAYSGVSAHGCNCHQEQQRTTDNKHPEKRLLDNSDC